MFAWVLTLNGRRIVTVVDRLKRYEDVTKTFILNIMVQLRSPNKNADAMLLEQLFMVSTIKACSDLLKSRKSLFGQTSSEYEKYSTIKCTLLSQSKSLHRKAL